MYYNKVRSVLSSRVASAVSTRERPLHYWPSCEVTALRRIQEKGGGGEKQA